MSEGSDHESDHYHDMEGRAHTHQPSEPPPPVEFDVNTFFCAFMTNVKQTYTNYSALIPLIEAGTLRVMRQTGARRDGTNGLFVVRDGEPERKGEEPACAADVETVLNFLRN